MRRKRRTRLTTLALALFPVAATFVARRFRRFDLRDRVVFISGGSRGLGLVLAREYARKGARLALLGRDPETLDRARVELADRGADVAIVACDVTDRAQVDDAVEQVLRRFGRIDVLVNCAGDIEVGPLEAMEIEDFERAMATNLWGPLYLARAVIPTMRAEGGGRIVNVSSIGGLVSVPHLLPYTTSKFALTGLSYGLRAELAKDGIVVTTVCPGLMRTGSPVNALFKGDTRAELAWFSVADSLPGLSMSAERAARRIVSASRRGEARVVLTLPAKIGAFAHALAPGLTNAAFSLANRLLPRAEAAAARRAVKGSESRSHAIPAWLTALGDRAAQRNNQVPPKA
jgi:NAD(P)-dependent dehydrogenase (short-subunit alcohol dehydrogenase family)